MIRNITLLTTALLLIASATLGAAREELAAAAQAGKVSFVLVYDASATGLDQARQLSAEAVLRVPGSVAIELDRGDPANAEFVGKYRLATAPVPVILVTSANGVITGGALAVEGMLEQLVKLVPSPKKAEIIHALSEGNAVFITVSRKDMVSTATVNNACAAACQQMAGKSMQITIDMDDPAETRFLTEMKVNLQSTEPVTLVANAQGQISGIYTGALQVTDLVTAATKKVGGCCPSTVAKPDASCAPTQNK
jgi:hypothetical protein